MNNYTIIGRVLHFIDEPDLAEGRAYEYHERGALVVDEGALVDVAIGIGRLAVALPAAVHQMAGILLAIGLGQGAEPVDLAILP